MRTGALFAVVLASCASEAPAVKGSGDGEERVAKPKGALSRQQLTDDVRAAASAQAEAQKRCGALEAQPIPYDEEVYVGLELSAELIKQTPNRGVSSDAGLLEYLNLLGRGLADFSGRSNIAWTFLVLDSDKVASWAAPGGYVWVTTGLLKSVRNEAELAGVLASEVSNVAQRHGLRDEQSARVAACVASSVAGSLGKSATTNAPGELDITAASADLNRSITTQTARWISLQKNHYPSTDPAAVELISFAGYDPRAFGEWLEREAPRRAGDVKGEIARQPVLKTARPELPPVVVALSGAR